MANRSVPFRPLTAQLGLPGFCPVENAVAELAAGGIEARGAVFTRREVVDFILDLVGYTSDRPLHELRLLEPSFGEGDFLFPALDRLIEAATRELPREQRLDALLLAVRAVELHHATYAAARELLHAYLQQRGFSEFETRALAQAWLVQGDFLLTDFPERFTHVVGNPPYVRQELVPDALMSAYRARFATIYDRADLYVPFIEHGLRQLAPSGRLGFICADRWMKNRYGAPLRAMVADHYRLHAYVDMVDTPAFHSDVIAYPAIFVIGNGRTGPTRVAHRPLIDRDGLAQLAKTMTAARLPTEKGVSEIASVGAGANPWVLDSPRQMTVIRQLEAVHPTLEEAGCKIGIGVATGADKIFVGKFEEMDVEPARKLPLVMARDIASGSVDWRGYGVLNPFEHNGELASLSRFPRFAAYLQKHGEEIRRRHVSKKNPGNWYRTIDRIYPSLTAQPKLLIPDIKGHANVVHEEGRLYPHHNLYFVTSDTWELKALQAVLRSVIAREFILAYSTKMRGGYLRFQAQYLRRIRIPHWHNVPAALRAALAAVANDDNQQQRDDVVAQLYGLSSAQRAAFGSKRT